MLTEYERDEKQLFEVYFNSDILPKGSRAQYYINRNDLELTIRPDCNQKCEYCYLYKHGQEMYPERKSKEELLHNIDLLLEYVYVTRKNYFFTVDLFGGDLFYDGIFFDILDLLDKYFKDVKKNEPDIMKFRRTRIVIPSNLSFVVTKPEYVDKVKEVMNYFDTEYNTRIMFSWSTDGMYATGVREKKELDEEHFETIFKFCREVDAGYHPMISAVGVDTLKENYDWWLEKHQTYGSGRANDFQPMMLEVRNDDWTEERIAKYMDFIKYAIDKRLEMCNNSTKQLAYHFFVGDGADNTLPRLENYDFLSIVHRDEREQCNESISCAMQSTVYLDCTKLALILCHRTAYSQFIPVYFITDENNEHIVDFKTHNIDAYLALRTMKIQVHPVCVNCDFNYYCIHGCLGAQYEDRGEILLPNRSVCRMYTSKIMFILKTFGEMGVTEEALKYGYIRDNTFKQFVIDKSKELGFDYEQYR